MTQRSSRRWILSALVLGLAVAGPVWAQEAAPAGPDPNQPEAKSVLEYIPGDCLGFVVVPNLKKVLADGEKFAAQIGLGEQLGQAAPDGLLPMLSAALGLGEGYNPNGGIAIVVTDLKTAGLDIEKMDPNSPPQPDQIPVVLLVAGKDVQSAFPAMAKEGEDGAVTVMTPMGMPMLTAQVGPYIALSPSQKVLDSLGKGKSVAATVAAPHVKLLQRNHVGLYYNMQAIAPVIRSFIKKQQEQREKMAAEGVAYYETAEEKFLMEFFEDYSKMMDMVNGAAVGMRLTADGVVVDSSADYVADSMLGKMVLAMKPTADTFLNRLPNQPYVFAMGGLVPKAGSEEVFKLTLNMIDGLLKTEDLAMPEGIQEKFLKLASNFTEQTDSIQIVGGGTKGAGLFGVGAVMDVKDADATKKLIGDQAALITEFVHKTFAKVEPDVEGLNIAYQKGAGTVGGVAVDAVNVTHPEMDDMTDENRAEMAKVLGDTKIRVLVANPDAKTVVGTFGGGEAFLGASIAAAKLGGGIDKDPGVQTAFKHLPAKRVFTMVFSAKNLKDAVRTGAERMGEDTEEIDMVDIKSTTPIAAASTTQGTAVMSTMFVPADLIKDGVNLFMMFAGGGPGGGEDATAEPANGDF